MSKNENNFTALVELMKDNYHVTLDVAEYFNFGRDENIYFVVTTRLMQSHNILKNLMYVGGPILLNFRALDALAPGVNMFIDQHSVSRPFDNIILLDTLYEFRNMIGGESFQAAYNVILSKDTDKINEFFTEEFINAHEKAAGLD